MRINSDTLVAPFLSAFSHKLANTYFTLGSLKKAILEILTKLVFSLNCSLAAVGKLYVATMITPTPPPHDYMINSFTVIHLAFAKIIPTR